MQVTALIQVINYLKAISGDPSLLDGYKKLSEIIKEASIKPEEDHLTTILKEKEQLVNDLLDSDPVGWGYTSYSLFDRINSNKLFGRSAADYIENLVTPDGKDFKGIYSALDKKIKLFSKLSDNLNGDEQHLDQIIPHEVFYTSSKTTNKSSLLLYFDGHLSVKNIDDLEKYARLWAGILDTFAGLINEENHLLNINDLNKNSMVVCAVAGERTISALETGVVGIVASLPLILKIRKIQNEITDLALQNDLNELLEEEILKIISNLAWSTSQKLVSLYNSASVDEDEMISDISRALKQILSFIEKGGRIKFSSLSPGPDEAKYDKIVTESFSIAKELETITDILVQKKKNREELTDVTETGDMV